MKTMFTLICCCAFTLMNAQNVPFVQKNKYWHVLGFSMGGDYMKTPLVKDYFFDGTNTEKNGKTYYYMYSRTQSLTNDTKTTEGLFREDHGRVYKYAENLQKELLAYDFTLNEGDEFEYTCEDGTKLQGKVTKEEDLYTTEYNPPLKAITIDFSEKEGNGYGATTTSCWIEGMGNNANPTDFVTRDAPNSWGYYTAYVTSTDGDYYPFPINVLTAGWSGKQLVFNEESAEHEGTDRLNYELIEDHLHVYGYMWTACSPNQYIYCIESNPGEVHFQIDELEPQADCWGSHKVDLYFPEFTGDTYVITDRAGSHTVNRAPEHKYLPLLEEGKCWKYIFDFAWAGAPKEYNYYYSYFVNGDTVINNITCKKIYMEKDGSVTYKAAMYEDGQKVYCFNNNSTDSELLYDFGLCRYDKMPVEKENVEVLCKNTKQSEYEGINRKEIYWIMIDSYMSEDYVERMMSLDKDYYLSEWIEGIGSTQDLFFTLPYDGNYSHIISCEQNGKTLYQDSYYTGIIDIRTNSNVSSQIFDFSGRRLNSVPKKGMYIKNGKKWLRE